MIAQRCVDASLVALTVFGIASHASLATAGVVSVAWLGIALVCGIAFALRRAATEPVATDETCPRWLTITAWCVLGVVFVVLCYGAVATPARHWDGTTSWSLRAHVLADAPTLRQPFFEQVAVYGHSREYPLLQPLLQGMLDRCVRGAGGLVLPAMFGLLLAACASTWRASGVDRVRRTWLTLAAALTPMWIAPTSGAVDSGFAEVSLAASVTCVLAGVARDRALWIATGTFLAVLTKPEGIAYPLALALACWWLGSRRQLVALLMGHACGVVVWIPIYLKLSFSTVAPWTVPAATVTLAAVVIGCRYASDRMGRPQFARCVVLVVGCGLALVTPLALRDHVASVDGVLGVYLRGSVDALHRLGEVPAIVAGLLGEMVHVRKFGLTFVIVIALALAPRRWIGSCPARPLAVALGFGLLFETVPFLLSNEELAHHLRSSADRLLLHWTGGAWLLTGLWWQSMHHGEQTMRPPDRALGADSPS